MVALSSSGGLKKLGMARLLSQQGEQEQGVCPDRTVMGITITSERPGKWCRDTESAGSSDCVSLCMSSNSVRHEARRLYYIKIRYRLKRDMHIINCRCHALRIHEDDCYDHCDLRNVRQPRPRQPLYPHPPPSSRHPSPTLLCIVSSEWGTPPPALAAASSSG
jgi:hypothetical protein